MINSLWLKRMGKIKNFMDISLAKKRPQRNEQSYHWVQNLTIISFTFILPSGNFISGNEKR